jgi:mRNA interferase HigB
MRPQPAFLRHFRVPERCCEQLLGSSRYGNMELRWAVHVISYKAIREYKAARPDAGPSLDNWYRVTASCKWRSFAELRQVFASADWLNPYVAFNIAGNKHRLIAEINFRSQTLFIRRIMNHREYSQGKWKSS